MIYHVIWSIQMSKPHYYSMLSCEQDDCFGSPVETGNYGDEQAAIFILEDLH